MTEFLVPNARTDSRHYHDPYTQAGARSILRRFKPEAVAMLEYMLQVRDLYKDSPSPDGVGGKAFLAQSPLRRKPWVAGALKTLGFVVEVPSPNGACALILTQKAIDQLDALRNY
jgi:hypothetical protein